MVSFTTRFLFTFVDLAFAAAVLSKSAVAAIGFFAPFQAFYIAIWVGLSGGFTAALSNAFGHRDDERIAALKRTVLRMIYVIVPALGVGGVAMYFAVPRLGLPDDVANNAQIYCTTLMVGMPLTGFWAIVPDSVVKAHHDTRSTMNAGLIASFTNVGLNTLFVLGFHMGIFGIALATVLSRLGSLSYAHWRARRLEAARRGEEWCRSDVDWGPPLRTVLALAIPGALTFSLTGLEHGVVIAVLAGMPEPTTALASFAVFERVLNFSLMPAAGTAVAVVPFAARLLPMGLAARVWKDVLRTMAMVATASAAVTVLAGWVFATDVADFFVRNTGPAYPDAPASSNLLTLHGLRLLPLAALCAVPFYLCRPLFEAAQQPRLGVRLSVVRYLVLSVPLLWSSPRLARWLELDGFTVVILCLCLATALSSALAFVMARAVWNRC